MIYTFPTPDTAELLAIDKHSPSQTYIIDTRPVPDPQLTMNWRSQYRYVGPRHTLDLAWLARRFVVIVLGQYVEGTGEQL